MIKRVLNIVAPRHSLRRLTLSFIRDAVRNPRSLPHRLSAENFANHRTCSSLQIHCNVCGADTGVFYDYPNVQLRREHGIGLLRETLSCLACNASMRDRQMAYGLLKVIEQLTMGSPSKWRDINTMRSGISAQLKILDTDSSS